MPNERKRTEVFRDILGNRVTDCIGQHLTEFIHGLRNSAFTKPGKACERVGLDEKEVQEILDEEK